MEVIDSLLERSKARDSSLSEKYGSHNKQGARQKMEMEKKNAIFKAKAEKIDEQNKKSKDVITIDALLERSKTIDSIVARSRVDDSKPTVDSLLQRSRDGIASHQEPSNEEYAKLLKMKPKTSGMYNFEITSEAGKKTIKAKSFSEAKALFAKQYPDETLKNISQKGAADSLLERSRVADAASQSDIEIVKKAKQTTEKIIRDCTIRQFLKTK